jgi:nitrogen regulatory protein PII
MNNITGYDLIITIVNKGNFERVLDASKRAGADGGTIVFGRGAGIHEQAKLFSISIEPEKDIILTLIEKTRTEAVLKEIVDEIQLNEPGNGIAFVLDVEETVGVNHPQKRL